MSAQNVIYSINAWNVITVQHVIFVMLKITGKRTQIIFVYVNKDIMNKTINAINVK